MNVRVLDTDPGEPPESVVSPPWENVLLKVGAIKEEAPKWQDD
jgi:hypothetical protein